MTDTTNLGLPFIEASQAQKHVTHNEALRILDAAIQVAVLDVTRTAPPASPVEGLRHIVAASPTGAWAGRAKTIATWQDGAWAFLVPKNGWCAWSIADSSLLVFDGTIWRDQRNLALDNAAHLGVNTTAVSPNLLSVKSNAALFAPINIADGGSGDMRVQISKEGAAKTASVLFADNYSGRAEFGLVGSDGFKLKVSADGTSWTEALTIDQASGTLSLPRGLMLTGVIAPAQITANQNDYAPSGFPSASVVRLSTDAARSLSGLAGGVDGRVVSLVNVGSQTVTLLDDSASSLAGNRFALGGNIVLAAKQAALLRYDGTSARWQALAGGQAGAVSYANAQSLAASQQAQARSNLGVDTTSLAKSADYTVVAIDYGAFIKLTGTHVLAFAAATTLGDRFKCTVKNTGTGIWTLDPNGAEQIDGATTIKLFPGESCDVLCDGSAFWTKGRSTGLVLIQSQSLSGVGNVDFTAGLADFDSYLLAMADMVHAAANVNLRFSQAGSWIASADYTWNWGYVVPGGVAAAAGSNADISMNIGSIDTSGAGQSWSASIWLQNLISATRYKKYTMEFWGANPNANKSFGSGALKLTPAVDGIRVLLSTGTFSGKISLYGLRS